MPGTGRSCGAWWLWRAKRGCTPTVLTFDPHPARVLAPDRAPKLLMTIDQRLRGMEAEGIEAVFADSFFARIRQADAGRICGTDSRRRAEARVVLVGEDFRFGHKQAGNLDTLRELGGRFGFESGGGPRHFAARASASAARSSGSWWLRAPYRAPAGCSARHSRSKARSCGGRELVRNRQCPRSIWRRRTKCFRRPAFT